MDEKKKQNDNYNIRNILGKQKSNNNEFFTPKEPIYNLLENINLPLDVVIWCPFDKDDSHFVTILKEKGYKVINSHIDYGQDFYTYSPEKEWDVIISNPPFTQKRILIERCESFNKSFCLLYGATIFSQSMGNTLNRCSFIFIQKNIKFKTADDNIKSFQCAWILNRGFPWKK